MGRSALASLRHFGISFDLSLRLKSISQILTKVRIFIQTQTIINTPTSGAFIMVGRFVAYLEYFGTDIYANYSIAADINADQ